MFVILNSVRAIAPNSIFRWIPITIHSGNYIKHVTNNEFAAFIVFWRSIISLSVIFAITIIIIALVWLYYIYSNRG